MNIRKHGISFLIWLAIAMAAYAVVYPRQQVDPRRQARRAQQDKGKKAGRQDNKKNAKTNGANLNDLIIDDDSIPDSLLNPRWKIQRTTPITYGDLDQGVLDLQRPEGLRYEVVYNDSLDRYIIGAKFGGSYLSTPFMMTTDEYLKWSEKHARDAYFRSKNDEIYEAKGK